MLDRVLGLWSGNSRKITYIKNLQQVRKLIWFWHETQNRDSNFVNVICDDIFEYLMFTGFGEKFSGKRISTEYHANHQVIYIYPFFFLNLEAELENTRFFTNVLDLSTYFGEN